MFISKGFGFGYWSKFDDVFLIQKFVKSKLLFNNLIFLNFIERGIIHGISLIRNFSKANFN